MMSNTQHECPEHWDLGQLLAYVEGELEDAIRRSLEEHVERCSLCTDELESLRQIDCLLREHPESCHPADEDLYRFVAQGVDPDRKIIGHLARCIRCRDSVETGDDGRSCRP